MAFALFPCTRPLRNSEEGGAPLMRGDSVQASISALLLSGLKLRAFGESHCDDKEPVASRMAMVLFGDSITGYALKAGGWGQRLQAKRADPTHLQHWYGAGGGEQKNLSTCPPLYRQVPLY